MTIDEIREWRKGLNQCDGEAIFIPAARGSALWVIDSLLAEVDRLTVPYVVDIEVSPEDLVPGEIVFVPNRTTPTWFRDASMSTEDKERLHEIAEWREKHDCLEDAICPTCGQECACHRLDLMAARIKEVDAINRYATEAAIETIKARNTRNTAERCAEIAQNWRGNDEISCSHRLDIAAAIREAFGIEPKDHAAEVEEMAREI